MDDLELYPVQSKDIMTVEYVDEVISLLNSYHERNPGLLSTAEIFESLLNGSRMLWAGKKENTIEMILITEFQDESFFINLWVTKSGWDFSTWYPLIMSKLEQFARYFKCKELKAMARKGLAKKLKQDWDHEYCIITKQL